MTQCFVYQGFVCYNLHIILSWPQCFVYQGFVCYNLHIYTVFTSMFCISLGFVCYNLHIIYCLDTNVLYTKVLYVTTYIDLYCLYVNVLYIKALYVRYLWRCLYASRLCLYNVTAVLTFGTCSLRACWGTKKTFIIIIIMPCSLSCVNSSFTCIFEPVTECQSCVYRHSSLPQAGTEEMQFKSSNLKIHDYQDR